MVTEVRIYVEGGGDGKDGKAQVREGFSKFLIDLRNTARSKRIKWQIIACGPRNAAFRNFQNALESHPDAFNVLLVDAENVVTATPFKHLHQQDGWHMSGIADEQCHLMVQLMESWLIADIETLKRFYGQGFNAKPIPINPNVEDIPKQTVVSALRTATHNTTKGEYHKIRHSPRILAQLDVSKVRNAVPHCDRLFNTLAQELNTVI
ncbi:MAG TPA: DUF4276 family protein [Anaerolineae bacterium]|jgi:hypothetical protein